MNKLKIILFTFLILFVIIFSVTNNNTLLVYAKDISKNKFVGGYTIEELFIYRDKTCLYKFFGGSLLTPNKKIREIEKGNVAFKADTLIIALGDLNFKAIIKNNEIEFLDAFKMKLIKNKTSLKNQIYYSGFADYSFFTSTKYKSYDLNNIQIGIIDMILQSKVKSDKNANLNNNQYFKRCKAFLDTKNQIIVDINGELKRHKNQRYSFDDNVSDGGEGYFNASINLTTHEIIYFSFHGMA